jgi:signal transduction histidine kinase/FixJ family two-component response regulator
MTSVLVIDDEESIRYSFKRILNSAGYEAEVFSSYIDAEESVQKNDFSAAFIDRILLNNENGMDVAKKIKTVLPFCEVILISAYPTFESAAKTIEYDVFAYLTKPVKKDMLLNTLEKALKKSDSKKEEKAFVTGLGVLFDNSNEAVLMCSNSGSVRYANKAFLNMFLPDENTDVSDYLKIMDVKGYNEKDEAFHFFEQHSIEDQEVLIETKNRKNGIFLVTKFPYGAENIPSGSIIKIKDITEKKEIEKNMERAQRMEAIGNFAGGIAHDFNNILHVISGYAELVLGSSSENSETYKYVREILNATERGSNVTEQILSFSMQKDEKFSAVNIEPLLKEVVKFLSSTIPSTISVSKKIGSNVSPVYASPVKVHQLIMNLASNSKRAMSETGGSLCIGVENADPAEIKKIDSENKTKSGYVKIFVKDTGVGIPEENLDKIFQPFFTTGENVGGSGVGLSIVYGIINKLNGYINVESEPGKGTLFEIFLPSAPKNEISETDFSHSAESELKGKGIILFVDDDENIVKISDMMIKKLGYECVSFTDSEDAMNELLKNHSIYDVLITDMTMPKIRGDQLASAAAELNPLLPVILSTGFSEKINPGQEVKGVKQILQKPVTKEKLAFAIKEVMEK